MTTVKDQGLFLSARFWPLFVVQFIGAFSDNIYRNALLIYVTFVLADQIGLNSALLVSLAGGIFIAPYFLFSATAGQLADKYEKPLLTRKMKLIEIALMLGAGVSLISANIYGMMAMLFLLGTQSAFFGPIKFSLLPELLKENELVAGNGYIEAGTFVAILLGSICGGILVMQDHGPLYVTLLLTTLSIMAWLVSFKIKRSGTSNKDLRIDFNIARASLPLIKDAYNNKSVYRSILGISWLWFVGSVFLSMFPNYVKNVLHAEQELATLFMAIFSIGIAAGSLWCHKLLNDRISAQFVPAGALGMAFFGFLIYLFSNGYQHQEQAHNIIEFARYGQSWGIMVSMFLLAVAGGLFSVPLYAILQARSEPSHRARIVAANNIINAIFMVGASLFMGILLEQGLTIPQVFLATSLIGLIVAIYICLLLPQTILKSIFRFILRIIYNVKVYGAENAASPGRPAIYVVNHVSLLDGLLLGAFLPGQPSFAVNTHIAQKWWAKIFLQLVDYYPIDPTNPLALKSLIHLVEEGRSIVIFPEGRITKTGALMKVYEGPGVIADKAKAPIIPVRIDGAQYTPFSYLRGKLRLRWFPPVSLTLLPAVHLDIPAELKGRERRRLSSEKLYRILSEMIFSTCNLDQTLWQALEDASVIHGAESKIIEDIVRKPLTYRRLMLGSAVLGRQFSKLSAKNEIVGLMLPNSMAAAVAFFAMQLFNRVPAMLNFSAGAANLQAAGTASRIKTIITSRRFIAMAKLEKVVDELAKNQTLIYLEDIKSKIGFWEKLQGAMDALFSASLHRRQNARPNDLAVVLFTSGSEGVPKGVALTHKNILANRYQLSARIDFHSADTVFNALPIFHSFGLAAGFLLPVLAGVKTFLYPSPLHYRIVPELVYDTNSTILFGTDTFLTGYARMANPYDFYSLRYVFSGAEKVRDTTRRVWSDRFGLRVLEGYGATETSPALAMNTPMYNRPGSVGKLLPGISYRLEQVPGIAEGGRLLVHGPNIMAGYFKVDRPGVLQPPEDGWYDTGDIVQFDAHGFITIVGRVKRFAKIAGEMVSLSAVESYVSALWPDKMVAVINIPDDKKGEQLILFTNQPNPTRDEISRRAKELALSELMVPKKVVYMEKIPVLGTGKTDYVTLRHLAEEG
jgi:acyl-[acyl-carrier-protein]-phospholipid O-acyltransferase/long-chain-fatty-acid--[acyl-carrier-protein] ligase